MPTDALPPFAHWLDALSRNRSWSLVNHDWASLDWSQSNNELHRRTGIGIGTIARYRKKLAMPNPSTPPRGEKYKLTPEMIAAADWVYERDVDLGRKWGVSRERVRQLRQALHKPQCRAKNTSAKILELFRWIDENRAGIEGKHVADVLPLMPEASRPVRIRCLRKAGVKLHYLFGHSQCHPHWKLINWALPNIVIEMIWTSCSGINGIANARVRWSFGPPKWAVQRYDVITDDLIATARTEILRAVDYGVIPNEDAFNKWLVYRQQLIDTPPGKVIPRTSPQRPLTP